jgi:hypothetical protein
MTKRSVQLTMFLALALLTVALAAAQADDDKPVAPANPAADSETAMKLTVRDPRVDQSRNGGVAWGMWDIGRPHPMQGKGEFGGHDAIGIVAGSLIPTDCSLYWKDPDTHKILCFSSQASLVYFLEAPKDNTVRAEARWREMQTSGLAADDGTPGGGKTPPAVTITVIDFNFLDTSDEERDQRQEHDVRLIAFMAALRRDLAAQGKSIVAQKCDPEPCSVALPVTDLSRNAREAGAGMLLVGRIHKMSTLILSAKVVAIDTETGQIVLDKAFTFRGDDDDAWRSAEGYIAKHLVGM